jgi:hypothetical protein
MPSTTMISAVAPVACRARFRKTSPIKRSSLKQGTTTDTDTGPTPAPAVARDASPSKVPISSPYSNMTNEESAADLSP